MTPREEVTSKLIHEWLHKASIDMTAAECLMTDDAILASAVAFHCQQAAEKLLKAYLTAVGIEFPKTHDLKDLLDRIAPVNGRLATDLAGVATLTPYGVDLRYPDDRPDASTDDAQQALKLARQVRDTVLPLLPPASASS
jgi:HEPN domain-containing protein